MNTSRVIQPSATVRQDVAANVRNVIAEHLGIEAKRVSDEARFLKDLGADWLDRLELVIAIEDRFGLEIADDAVDRMEAVGDLVRFVESHPLH